MVPGFLLAYRFPVCLGTQKLFGHKPDRVTENPETLWLPD